MTKQFAENTDYKNMIDLLAIVTDATNRLQGLEAQFNEHMLEAIDQDKPEYAKLQQAITNATSALESIARAHPEWFEKKRSVKTPYGTVKFHKATKLNVPNEEASIILVNNWVENHPDFKRDDFVRTQETLNLEALEKLDDAVLRSLRITRVDDDKFSVLPARIDMGKAVQEAVESENEKAA